jgi:hypothetical protein
VFANGPGSEAFRGVYNSVEYVIFTSTSESASPSSDHWFYHSIFFKIADALALGKEAN